MTVYQEYSHRNYTLETFQSPKVTVVKLFDGDEEVVKLEYLTKTPIIIDCINNLIKLMQDDIYQHNEED